MHQAWIKQRLADIGKTPAELGRHLELPSSRVAEILGERRDIRTSEVSELSSFLEMDVAELVARLDGKPVPQKTARRKASAPGARPDAIPEVDVRAGMGGGGVAMTLNDTDPYGHAISTDEVRGQWDLPPEYLRHELRVSVSQARIIEVQGDSMEPTLRPGDRVMVNLADKRPSPPGVFAVWDGFGVVVKRIEPIPNSDPPTLRLISDNDRHGVYERTVDEVSIIGRVVWYSRRM